jgi:hypothetical protein
LQRSMERLHLHIPVSASAETHHSLAVQKGAGRGGWRGQDESVPPPLKSPGWLLRRNHSTRQPSPPFVRTAGNDQQNLIISQVISQSHSQAKLKAHSPHSTGHIESEAERGVMWPEMFEVDRSRDEGEPKISVRKFRSRRENQANASTVSLYCNEDDGNRLANLRSIRDRQSSSDQAQ